MKKNKKKQQKKGSGFDWSLVLQELLSFKMVFILPFIGLQVYMFFFEIPTITDKQRVFEILDIANYLFMGISIFLIILSILVLKGLFEGAMTEILVPIFMLSIVIVLFSVGLEYNGYQELKKQYDSTETVKIQGEENKEK